MELSVFSEEHFMQQAINEAEAARESEEIPVGAVVVCNNRIIARAHNQTEQLTDVTAHAEMLAITAASEHLGGKFLENCTLYVTLEPCAMCAAAMYWSRPDKLVFGAFDKKKGYTQYTPVLLHPKTLVKGGIMEEKAKSLLQEFFESKRG